MLNIKKKEGSAHGGPDSAKSLRVVASTEIEILDGLEGGEGGPLVETAPMKKLTTTPLWTCLYDCLRGRYCYLRLAKGLGIRNPQIERILTFYPNRLVMDTLKTIFETRGVEFYFGSCRVEGHTQMVIITHQLGTETYQVHCLQESKILNSGVNYRMVEYHIPNYHFVCASIPTTFVPINSSLEMFWVATKDKWVYWLSGTPAVVAASGISFVVYVLVALIYLAGTISERWIFAYNKGLFSYFFREFITTGFVASALWIGVSTEHETLGALSALLSFGALRTGYYFARLPASAGPDGFIAWMVAMQALEGTKNFGYIRLLTDDAFAVLHSNCNGGRPTKLLSFDAVLSLFHPGVHVQVAVRGWAEEEEHMNYVGISVNATVHHYVLKRGQLDVSFDNGVDLEQCLLHQVEDTAIREEFQRRARVLREDEPVPLTMRILNTANAQDEPLINAVKLAHFY